MVLVVSLLVILLNQPFFLVNSFKIYSFNFNLKFSNSREEGDQKPIYRNKIILEMQHGKSNITEECMVKSSKGHVDAEIEEDVEEEEMTAQGEFRFTVEVSKNMTRMKMGLKTRLI